MFALVVCVSGSSLSSIRILISAPSYPHCSLKAKGLETKGNSAEKPKAELDKVAGESRELPKAKVVKGKEPETKDVDSSENPKTKVVEMKEGTKDGEPW